MPRLVLKLMRNAQPQTSQDMCQPRRGSPWKIMTSTTFYMVQGPSGGVQGTQTGDQGTTTSTSTPTHSSSSGAAPTTAPGGRGSVRRRKGDDLPEDDQQAHKFVRGDSFSCRHCKLKFNSRNDISKHLRESNSHCNNWSDMDSE